MNNRKASIKESGEELSQEEWARFDAAVAEIRAERAKAPRYRFDDPAASGNAMAAKPRPIGPRSAVTCS